MNRLVPLVKLGLRAAALAAIVGGQSACVQKTPIATAPTGANLSASVASASVITRGSESVDAPQVVVRDYWNAPRADVVGWTDNEAWQGLRSAIRRDGTMVLDHWIYLSAYSAPNLGAFSQANWYAFNDAAVGGTQLQQAGLVSDQFSCQGKKGCSPFIYFRARVTDELLRQSHDSLVVKVVSYDGHETQIALRGELITSYLATVDSLSAVRKAKTTASNHN